MEESLSTTATAPATEDFAAALRHERERARRFLNDWRGTNEQLEQRLLAQLEATAQGLLQISAGDVSDLGDQERRRQDLEGQTQRLSALRQEVSQRETHLGQLQEQFAAQQQLLVTGLAQQAQELDERRTRLAQQEEQHRGHEEHLDETRQHLDERAAEIRQLLADLDQRQLEARQAELELQSHRQAHQEQVAFLHRQQAQLAEERQQCEELSGQLQTREQSLQERIAKTEAGRKQLAREVKLRRAEALAEIQRRRAELDQSAAADDAELEQQLALFQEELARVRKQMQQGGDQADELRRELDAARAQAARRDAQNRELAARLEEIASADHRSSAETAALAAELAEVREHAESQHVAAQVALSQARDDHETLRRELAEARQELAAAHEQCSKLESQAQQLHQQTGDETSQRRIKELEQERDALLDRLADAEKQPARAAAAVGSAESEELRRRFELAVEDVRKLKSRNAELEEKISRGAVHSGGAAAAGGAMDWESQKKRLLEQLESDFDGDDEQEQKDKMTVEGAIRITDGVVAEKDQEIAELQRLLSEQSQNLGGVAVGAAAIAQMLDDDALVRQEREKLETLQGEWREKLRKAEIDISVERAKIARERAQLEEKLKDMQARDADGHDAEGDDKGKKPKRGRWLARLGLGEEGQ
jgi:chromosome segregation ATPase